jgi:hypothetical protein
MQAGELTEPEWLFPFEGMAVGDSFFIPTLRTSELIYVASTRAQAAGVRVKSFAVVYDGVLGVRVWRTR